jgi:hypothetical protein
MENLRITGEDGRGKNIGISLSPAMREKNGMRWKRKNINQAGAKDNKWRADTFNQTK